MTIVLIAIILFCVGADQLTKLFIYGHDAAFIRGLIRFESVENRGMVWGLLNGVKGAMAVIAAITAVVIVILIFITFKYRKKMGALMAISFAMVIGGAIGNLIDRIALGFVRDFICTEFIEFPVFNVADAFVTVGAILLGIMLIFTRKGHDFYNALFAEKKPAEKAETENDG